MRINIIYNWNAFVSRLGLFPKPSASTPVNLAGKQAEASLEPHHTPEKAELSHKFSLAIAHLGDREPHIRIGGIYELERIAKDHKEDYHLVVMEILSSLIRRFHRKGNRSVPISENAMYGLAEEYRLPKEERPNEPHELQAAVTVVCRRDIVWEQRALPDFILDLRGSDLHQLQLEKANLYRANLTDTNLYQANLKEANLYQANLTRAYLQFSDLAYANLTNANLSEANLSGATLTNTTLKDANLTHANMRGANLREANLDNANLDNANLLEANLTYATLIEATLIEAKLCGTHMRGANLCGANLYKANLVKAHLFEATLFNAFLTGAELDNTDLSGADLRTSRNLEFAQLSRAIISDSTLLPEQFEAQLVVSCPDY